MEVICQRLAAMPKVKAVRLSGSLMRRALASRRGRGYKHGGGNTFYGPVEDAGEYRRRPQNVFIVSAIAGVGKTYISTLLSNEFTRLGYHTSYMTTDADLRHTDEYPADSAKGCTVDIIDHNRELFKGHDDYEMMYDEEILGHNDEDLFRDHEDYRRIYEDELRKDNDESKELDNAVNDINRPLSHFLSFSEELEKEYEQVLQSYEDLRGAISPQNIVIVEGTKKNSIGYSKEYRMIFINYTTVLMQELESPAIFVTDISDTRNDRLLLLSRLERLKVPLAGVVINNAQNSRKNVKFMKKIADIQRYIGPAPCVFVDYKGGGLEITKICKYFISLKPGADAFQGG